ncbi:HicB family protein [Dictyobacter alpinus]|uniref:HicB family protein n=1 Tax=Dictyobacter alpinus TaxID=2014873 RepID=A0A402B472_9CHLR|nr:type II toxin-antitoxin system HicB family antitoxin [Dictyobacter alpinus]GCE26130.1 HicB family protein [Dictyobacter alpinus]
MSPIHYSVIIQWSNVDQAFIAEVPELPGCSTHGDTYEEAIKNAQEVIELWLENAMALGKNIPPPRVAA